MFTTLHSVCYVSCVVLAFQEQPLLQAVQSGLLFKIKETLSWLEQLNNSKDIGKGSKGAIKGTKKIAISNNQGKIQEEIVEQFVVRMLLVNFLLLFSLHIS